MTFFEPSVASCGFRRVWNPLAGKLKRLSQVIYQDMPNNHLTE